MTGITVLDRRDLERVLKHLLYAAKRDDVKVSVKYYVQFSVDEDYSAQTIVDPWEGFNRAKARQLVDHAIKMLDAEEEKKIKEEAKSEALEIVTAATPDVPVPDPEPVVMSLDTGYYDTKNPVISATDGTIL